MKRHIKKDFNCVDVGCHKGEMLEDMLVFAGSGKHFAFEPIPDFFQDLQRKFAGKATILPYALSDKSGTTTFQWVKNAPAYSGIRERRYDTAVPDIEEITVELRTLDEVIPTDVRIDFIKIDVEGGELGVLLGADRILQKNQPLVIFEFGKGASDYYGTTPGQIFDILCTKAGLKIYTPKAFANHSSDLSLEEFEQCYQDSLEYYFVAGPKHL